jgi:hypothetical protein
MRFAFKQNSGAANREIRQPRKPSKGRVMRIPVFASPVRGGIFVEKHPHEFSKLRRERHIPNQ